MGGGRSLGLKPAARMVRKYLAPEDTRAFRDFATEVQREQHERTVVVSTGTPPATFNLVVAGMLKATSIVVMTPSLLPRNLFGLNIVPAHDWRGGEVPANVIVSALALAYFDETAGEHLSIQLRRDHELSRARVYWGLALGGPSKSAPWQREHLLAQLKAVLDAAAGESAKLLVTTSRRTPEWCSQWLNEQAGRGSPIAYMLDAARNPLNPLPAFFALCNRMLVTADSFSMVSEAANAGFRVALIGTADAPRSGKLGRSLAYLVGEGIATEFSPLRSAPGRSPGEDATRPWKYNWHYDEMCAAVRLKLGL
jgi:mitochondrial fission protein ELM1